MHSRIVVSLINQVGEQNAHVCELRIFKAYRKSWEFSLSSKPMYSYLQVWTIACPTGTSVSPSPTLTAPRPTLFPITVFRWAEVPSKQKSWDVFELSFWLILCPVKRSSCQFYLLIISQILCGYHISSGRRCWAGDMSASSLFRCNTHERWRGKEAELDRKSHWVVLQIWQLWRKGRRKRDWAGSFSQGGSDKI